MNSSNFSGIRIRTFNLNVGLRFTFKHTWTITSLYLTETRVESLCKGCIITRSTLLVLSLSRNGMKYVCPDAISNITSLRYLEVSFNNLSDINVRHTHLFERLFSTLREIQIISLKSNSLRHIPKNIYFNNNNLRKIDCRIIIYQKLPLK